MKTAGTRTHLLQFQSPNLADEVTGAQQDGWVDEFRSWGSVRWLRGGETVIAARLTGRQPAVITIPRHERIGDVTSAWRLSDVETGTVYAIRSIVPTDDRAHYEITVESGVPT